MWQALDWRGGNPVLQVLVTRWTGAQSVASVFEQLNTKGRFSELLYSARGCCDVWLLKKIRNGANTVPWCLLLFTVGRGG